MSRLMQAIGPIIRVVCRYLRSTMRDGSLRDIRHIYLAEYITHAGILPHERQQNLVG